MKNKHSLHKKSVMAPWWAVWVAICVWACGSGAFAATVVLQDIDSGSPSPSGQYRWLDVADQHYSESYRTSYHYTQANVVVTYEAIADKFRGTIQASNLKPNFAYQIKLNGDPGTACNERIGLTGRWWQEEWDGTKWTNGQNLNNKGDGTSPNPNDQTYFSRRDIADSTSPTGKKYRFTGYLVLGYFITDDNGSALVSFCADSSYHVLWKTTQRSRTSSDGPVVSATFDPVVGTYYDTDYPSATVSIFGEWERLPVGGVCLPAGDYDCQIMLTEESFHGSGGTYAGSWAAAMGGRVQFTIDPPVTPYTFYDDKDSAGYTGAGLENCPILWTDGSSTLASRTDIQGWNPGYKFTLNFPRGGFRKLALGYEFPGTGYKGVDLSGYGTYRLTIRNDGAYTFGAKIFYQSCDANCQTKPDPWNHWAWQDSGGIDIAPGRSVSFAMVLPPTPIKVTKIGFEVYKDLAGAEAETPVVTVIAGATGSIEFDTQSTAAYSCTRDVVVKAADSSGTVLKTWTVPVTFTNDTGNKVARGNYTVTEVPSATASLSAKTAWSLRQKRSLTLDGHGQAWAADFAGYGKLLGGDLNGSNSINILDYVKLKTKWYTSDAGADINGDGTVNGDDYAIMKANWFKVGEPE